MNDDVDCGATARNLHHKTALEVADLGQRAQTVRAEFRELGRRRLALQEEWRRLRIERTYLEDERRRFEDVRCSPWFQAHALPTAKGRRVKLNVGGQLFETTADTLLRDPDSMLAAMAGPVGPLAANDGCFYIDRDWWLFRHILTFLRDGKLPSRRRLLSQLYREADYYNLVLLRRAVRERLDPAYVVERTARVPLGAVDEIVRVVPPPTRTPLVAGPALPPARSRLRRSMDDFDFEAGRRARRLNDSTRYFGGPAANGYGYGTALNFDPARDGPGAYWRKPLPGGLHDARNGLYGGTAGGARPPPPYAATAYGRYGEYPTMPR
jgi:hypothetical protein